MYFQLSTLIPKRFSEDYNQKLACSRDRSVKLKFNCLGLYARYLSLALRLNAAKPSARDDRVFCTQDNGKGLPLNWGYVFG